MMFSPSMVVVGALLLLVQVLAALPWLAAALLNPGDWVALRRNLLSPPVLVRVAIGLGLILLVAVVNAATVQEKTALETTGQIYGAVLQIQLLLDAFVIFFAVLLRVWPKGGAVALAAFREGVRQSMFWLLAGLAFMLMTASPLIPYWTFGEDHLVVKDIGYDTIMLVAVVFGALAASMSVSEEIEGRTAVTLMSKPVSRRQFLLGKFVGIVMAAGVLFALLGTYFEGVLLFKNWWDRLDPAPTAPWLVSSLASFDLSGEAADLLRGVGMWAAHTIDTMPGLILAFSQVMVLVAIAVSLATRVPMVVNLATVLVIFFLSHLTPVLVSVAHNAQITSPGSTVAQLLAFAAQLLDTILPNLDSFRIDPALLGDAAPPPLPFGKYIASLSLYGLLYTGIALLFGLILFEDRDLA